MFDLNMLDVSGDDLWNSIDLLVVIGNIKNYLVVRNYILKNTHSQIQKKFFGKIALGTRNFIL